MPQTLVARTQRVVQENALTDSAHSFKLNTENYCVAYGNL